MASSATEIAAILTEKLHTDGYAHLKEQNRALAAQAAEYARSIAPIGGDTGPDPHPRPFRAAIHGEAAPDRKGLPASRIRSDDDNSSYIEYGTSKTPEHGTFAKTAAAFSGVNNPRINALQSGPRKGQRRV